jgi:YbgC/YbaW family acyl-CoA thioester hydrolase
MKNLDEILELTKKFNHKISGKVKFHEVDAFNVVHNLQYLYWTEFARTEYCKHIGINTLHLFFQNQNDFTKADNSDFSSILLVHNEARYFTSATFDDEYSIYTRISKLGKTSITFENIVTKLSKNNKKTEEIPLCINTSVDVYVDKNHAPTPIPAEIREKIINFEKENLIL